MLLSKEPYQRHAPLSLGSGEQGQELPATFFYLEYHEDAHELRYYHVLAFILTINRKSSAKT